jgi:hypothetical protein
VGSSVTSWIFPNSLGTISPLGFLRLQNIAKAYEMFKFHKLKFTYVPTCTTDARGMVALSIDYDYDDGSAYLGNGLAPMLVNRSACFGPAYTTMSCELDGKHSAYAKYYTKPDSFTGVDNVQKFQGVLIYGGIAGTLPREDDPYGAGYIMCDYDIELFSPGSA